MKTLLLIISILLCATWANGQNYLGLSQSKIVKRYGQPDFKDANYFVYFDQDEGGTNTYFFDEKKICNSFVLTRNSNYLKLYQKMLLKDFSNSFENLYFYKSKKLNLKAELTESSNEFQVRIAYEDENTLNLVNNDWFMIKSGFDSAQLPDSYQWITFKFRFVNNLQLTVPW